MGAGRKLAVQPFAEVLWHLKLECHAITHQAHHIARAVVDRGAVLANFEVRFDSGAQLRADISFQIIGDLAPHFYAADFDDHFSVQAATMAAPSRTHAHGSSFHRFRAQARRAFAGARAEALS